MIFQTATARSLAYARVIIFAALLIDVLPDNLEQLALMPKQTLHPHGMLLAIPSEWYSMLLSTTALLLFKWTYVAVLLLGLGGVGPRLVVSLAAAAGTIWFHGIARSFGGHVNHQELIVLHSLFVIMFFPSFDALSLRSLWRRRSAPPETAMWCRSYA